MNIKRTKTKISKSLNLNCSSKLLLRNNFEQEKESFPVQYIFRTSRIQTNYLKERQHVENNKNYIFLQTFQQKIFCFNREIFRD